MMLLLIGSVTMHARYLQTLAAEMFKVYKNLSPAITARLFHVLQNNYNLRNNSFLFCNTQYQICVS